MILAAIVEVLDRIHTPALVAIVVEIESSLADPFRDGKIVGDSAVVSVALFVAMLTCGGALPAGLPDSAGTHGLPRGFKLPFIV
jgi:hypothetical protein